MARFPVSDHFNGKKFFNPHFQTNPGFWALIRLITTLKYERWPKWVENQPDLKLTAKLAPNEVAITFVNHATVLLQFPGLTVLTDPVWAHRVSPFSFAGPKRVRAPGIRFEELPKIDLVLVSHNHYDHMDLATLKRLQAQHDPEFIVALGDRPRLLKLGLTKVTELDWWATKKVSADTQVTFTPTQHFSSRGLFDRNACLWGAFVIEHQGHKIYFGGDAGYSVHFKETSARFGAMDLSLIPIGAYEPRWFMSAIHMNPEEAVQAHLDLQSKQSLGIHFGTFQLTEEAIDAPVVKLAESLRERAIDPKTFVAPVEGVTKSYFFP